MSRKNELFRAAPACRFADLPRTVLLVGGPYDGQDIRATAEEVQQGLLVRGEESYVASVDTAPAVRSRLPLFLWLQQAKASLFPFLAIPCGI